MTIFIIFVYGQHGWEETNLVIESPTKWQAQKEAQEMYENHVHVEVERDEHGEYGMRHFASYEDMLIDKPHYMHGE